MIMKSHFATNVELKRRRSATGFDAGCGVDSVPSFPPFASVQKSKIFVSVIFMSNHSSSPRMKWVLTSARALLLGLLLTQWI
jgi:hypothetical protein